MNRLLPFSLVGALALAAASGAIAASEPPAWPQAASDLAPDPAVRFGMLANGMRYAVMRNATPGGQTSLRLRIGSGSLEENDAEQGLAHVLEHMSFKGSTHVGAGEMVKILQRHGLAFGPDTNAATGWTQTVYMLDLPRSDADTLDTGLMLMRETAGELLIKDDALTPERGVVLSIQELMDVDLLPESVRTREIVKGVRLQLAEFLPPMPGESAMRGSSPSHSLFEIMEEVERRIIVDMLERTNWNQTEAAERFQIPLSTLNQKIKRLGIETRRRTASSPRGGFGSDAEDSASTASTTR